MDKSIICYFSASGTTKDIAEKLASEINADLFEIEPVEKYTIADLDWTNKNSRSSIEMNDLNFRPPIKNKLEDLNMYTNVIIGFPVWWYTAPTIINTFIESHDLKNKRIFVFVTSGGSSVTKSYNDLKENYPNLNFIDSKRIKELSDIELFKKLL